MILVLSASESFVKAPNWKLELDDAGSQSACNVPLVGSRVDTFGLNWLVNLFVIVVLVG